MMHSLMISNDTEINQLMGETVDEMRSMDVDGLKVMMLCGAILFKTSKERLAEIEGSVDNGY